MEFTIIQTGYFREEIFFDVPDEVIQRKLKEYREAGKDYDEAEEDLKDFIMDNRWDYHTDYGDNDQETEDWEACDDFQEGIDEALKDYTPTPSDIGER